MMHSNVEDQVLIERCLRGDQRSWDELVERYERLVYSVPRRFGLGETDAADVFQQVFINLFRHLESVREVERLAGWLLTTAQRETWRVGRRRRSDHALPHDVVDLGGPSETDIVRAERQQLVRRGLAQLGGRCEKLLTALFLASGAPNYEAIAAELDMKVGSIGPTRARCFEKLERILVDLGVDAEAGAHTPVD